METIQGTELCMPPHGICHHPTQPHYLPSSRPSHQVIHQRSCEWDPPAQWVAKSHRPGFESRLCYLHPLQAMRTWRSNLRSGVLASSSLQKPPSLRGCEDRGWKCLKLFMQGLTSRTGSQDSSSYYYYKHRLPGPGAAWGRNKPWGPPEGCSPVP